MYDRLKQLKNILTVFPSVRDIIGDIRLDYGETSDGYFGELQISYAYDFASMSSELHKRNQDRERYVPFKDRSPFGKLDFIIGTFSSGNSFMVDTFQHPEITMGSHRQIDNSDLDIIVIRGDTPSLFPYLKQVDFDIRRREFSMMAHVGNKFVELIDETLELSDESLKLFLRVRYDMVEE